MSAEQIEIVGAIEPLEREWDELAVRTRLTPFRTPGWTAAWWRAFGRGSLELVTVRRGGRLAGVVPFRRWRRTLRSPTNPHTPEFGFAAEDAPTARVLAEASLEHAGGRLALEYVDPSGIEAEALRSLAAERSWLVFSMLERSPYVWLGPDWQTFEKSLRGKVVAELARSRRKIERNGVLRFEVVDGRQGLDDLLAEGLRLETSGWKAERGTAIISHAETRRFYTDVARWAADRGWLRLSFLRLDDRAIAFQYGLEHQGVYYFLKGGFDPAFRPFAPGKLLIHDLLRWATSAGLRRFEFLGTDEPWKLNWARLVHDRVMLQTFPRSPLGLARRVAAALYLEYGRPFAKRVLARLR